ncbi:hypothetical protein [Allobranchiibius sp. GilTou38]|uniref:hypothetical protein n=1 Tax=Allobranchiibius sp. GilTou38 TaxID=2815210 RepID=UPI001AA11FE3|nr:hypothetical protein [Allobranchiibius sp. GilTou38]MBO1765788.1 hypothetical protein [Allobranchiibius sp. GilTou38]
MAQIESGGNLDPQTMKIWGASSPRYTAYNDGSLANVEMAATNGEQAGFAAALPKVKAACVAAVKPTDYHGLVHSPCAKTLLVDAADLWSGGALDGQNPAAKYGPASDHYLQVAWFLEDIAEGLNRDGLLQGMADGAPLADRACISGTPNANAALSGGAPANPNQPSASVTTVAPPPASGPVATAGVAHPDDNPCVNSFANLLDAHSGLTKDQALAAAPDSETKSILTQAFARMASDITGANATTYWSNATARDDAASLFNGYCASHSDTCAVVPHVGPAGSTDCGADQQGGEIYAGSKTSCPFAKAIAAAWWQQEAGGSTPTQIVATSPVTRQEYTLECTNPPSPQCTATSGGATVYLGQ